MRPAFALFLFMTGCGTFGIGEQPTEPRLATVDDPVEGVGLLPDGLIAELGTNAIYALTRAQADALVAETGGTPVPWTYEDVSGRVVPGPKYMVNTRLCRDLVHVAERDRNRISGRATLCLSRDGSWERVD